MSLKDSLDQAGIDGLMRGLVRGRYHALLGAGASAGGSSRDGRLLPVGMQLATELENVFGLAAGAAARYPLSRIYAAAAKRLGAKGETLEAFMSQRFIGTTPPAWMRHFASIPWAHLWTLNVDDALERSYSSHSDIARQTPLSTSWTEPHRVARDSRSEVLLVHLHGKASRGAKDLVFDISSYINALEAQHRWHRIFGDSYAAHPFIVIGASLDSELDLEQVLRLGRTRGSEHPSIIVLRDCDELQADFYSECGLVVIRATADDFMAEVSDLMPAYLLSLTQEETDQMANLAPEAQAFLHEWHELDETPWPRRIDKGHRYYTGHEPTWRDVLDDLPFRRHRETDVVEAVTRDLAPGASAISLVAGEAFAGKSSVMLSAARELQRRGWRPFYFDYDKSPDRTAVQWWVAQHPKTVLFLDDATDFAIDVEAMVRTAASGLVSLRFVLADRSSQRSRLDKVLHGLDVTDCFLDGRLRDAEVGAMLSKLDSKRRLGILQNVSRRERETYVKSTCRRSVFETMASLEDGRGFRERIADEWSGLVDPDSRTLLGVASVAARVGYAVPFELLRAAAGLNPREAEQRVRATRLHDIMTIREDEVHLRHRGIGEQLASQCIPITERLGYAQNLALALAPHVSPAAISANSLAYRMARSLMARTLILELADRDLDAALGWYSNIEKAYDWNARFWEQRALLAAEAESFEEAFSWSQVAVDRRRDAYSLNTVGTVLMRRAIWESSPRYWPARTYEAAVDALHAAREMEGRDSEYPYETFFSYTGRLVERVKDKDGPLRAQLNATWVDWQVSAIGLAGAARTGVERVLAEAQVRWDRSMGV